MTSCERPGQPFRLEPAWLVRSSRSDRGAQYLSKALRQLLLTLGVRQSPYTVATCEDNAAGEACHRRLDLSTPTPRGCTPRLATCPGRLRASLRSGEHGSRVI